MKKKHSHRDFVVHNKSMIKNISLLRKLICMVIEKISKILNIFTHRGLS